MPQLIAEDWAPQLIWLAITFFALYIMMARVALPRIANVIEQRRDKIADDLDEAHKLKKEAEDAIAAYEASLTSARAKAHTIAAETRDKVNAETDQQKQDLGSKLAEQMKIAEIRIKASRDAAMANVKDVATDTASAIVIKLLDGTTDDAAVAAAVDTQLA
jgi:F-type H+-transporting ATPase subunit b